MTTSSSLQHDESPRRRPSFADARKGSAFDLTVHRTSDESTGSRKANNDVAIELEALGASLKSVALPRPPTPARDFVHAHGAGTPTYFPHTPDGTSAFSLEAGTPERSRSPASARQTWLDNSGTSTDADADTDVEEIDGGARAWLVVAACAYFFTVTMGLVYSFGVLQSELIGRGLTSASTLGWVGSVSVLPCTLLATPFASMVNRFGTSKIALLGAVLTGGGYVLTSFSLHSVPFLFISQTIFGCGYAGQFWSCGSISATYFTRRGGLATGIVYAGSGVGGAVFSVALASLIKRVDLEWAVRIYGLVALASLVPTSFLIRERVRTPSKTWSFQMFKNPRFTLLWIATATVTFTLYIPSFFLPTYASSAGYNTSTGAWLVAGYNLSSAAGRILYGLLADTRVGPVTTLMLAMTINSVSILSIWVVSSSLPALVIFLIANGSAGGALFSLQPSVNASLFGLKDIALTMAMIYGSRTFGSALGPPIAGYLLDAFGGPESGVDAYRPALLLLGFLPLASAAMVLAVRWRVAGWDIKKRV